MADEFARALRLMRRRDPQLAEDGFQRLRATAGEHVDRLIDEFRNEPDHGIRCWLLELIAEARSPRAHDLLVGQLRGGDESLRSWAEHGLRLLDTKEARTALWEHASEPS
ncbi:HEAT repeat domain-containing protein [Asanoa iriomotensis]|uniref:HEAT repeat domain-containing protein n=1 Tax=Asanoa iriomotensis TaxID=234613 RepID=A0ABQ4BWW8_9ACTN|nr:HEAT repeat domain-containing protein [Asanoa iriomotensis]GIF55024.1 hypothetical protein Air01nite_11190 [Asanoa iriomotensis]